MARLTSNGIRFSSGDALNSRRQIFALNTAWVFYQASAPVGWAKSTTDNDKALRVVSGTAGGSSGGTSSFSTVMSTFNVGGSFSFPTSSTGGRAITLGQTPIHAHGNGGSIQLNAVPASFNPDGNFTNWNGGDVRRAGGWTRNSPATGDTEPTSLRGQNHSHPFSASASLANQPINIAVQYIDVIICKFNG
jgi:hypothetical protein